MIRVIPVSGATSTSSGGPRRDAIREAVMLAGAVLAAWVDKLLSTSGAETPVRTRKRLHKSLLKYVLRLNMGWARFGMSAGVAVLPVGDREPVLAMCRFRHVWARRVCAQIE